MSRGKDEVLILGGAGFIGSHLADRLCRQGRPVMLFDNLSGSNSEKNLDILMRKHPSLIRCTVGDFRDREAIREVVGEASAVFHLVAQSFANQSMLDPISDFEINTWGTVSLLEALRARETAIPLIYASSARVTQALEGPELRESDSRYEPADPEIRCDGISEDRTIALSSPLACSRVAAENYIRGYSKCFEIPSVVLRLGAVYGQNLDGSESRGWLGDLNRDVSLGRSLQISGNGKQVRDLLHIDDLVDAFLLSLERISDLEAGLFHVGGGVENSLSLLEWLIRIGPRLRQPLEIQRVDENPGDFRYYVSCFSRFEKLTGWKPRKRIDEGLGQ